MGRWTKLLTNSLFISSSEGVSEDNRYTFPLLSPFTRLSNPTTLLKQLIKFYHISTPATPLKKDKKKLKRLQWATFLSATAGYGIYYVCRLSLNVVKKPIVEEGIFSETELGIIGAVLFFTYAIGKFTNGFLADRSNIRRFMSTGLLITALANLCLGFTHSFILFAILWGISGWFQSMGTASCVVGLSRWYENKKRGSF